VRDLFGRHVGREVATAAERERPKLGGEERHVAVVYVDIIASTQLVTKRPGTCGGHQRVDLVAINGQISWPSKGRRPCPLTSDLLPIEILVEHTKRNEFLLRSCRPMPADRLLCVAWELRLCDFLGPFCLVGTVGSTVITIDTDQPVGVFSLGKVHWRPYVPNTVAGRSDMSGLHKSAAPRTGQGHQPAQQPKESKKIYRHRLSKVSPLYPEVTRPCLPHCRFDHLIERRRSLSEEYPARAGGTEAVAGSTDDGDRWSHRCRYCCLCVPAITEFPRLSRLTTEFPHPGCQVIPHPGRRVGRVRALHRCPLWIWRKGRRIGGTR
jgi:hypothetical protein